MNVHGPEYKSRRKCKCMGVFFLSNSRITRIIEFITRLVIQNHEIEMKRLYINLLTDYSVGTMGTGYKISNRLVVYM